MRRRNQQHKLTFWFSIGLMLLLSGGWILWTTSANVGSPLVINEFLAGNDSSAVDEDGDYSDWIEVYNRSDQPVNLSGWSLTDEPERPLKWPFPEMTLGSHHYLLVFASGKNRVEYGGEGVLHTNFKLSKTDQFLGLHNVLEARFMDQVTLDSFGYFRNVSYGRYEDVAGYFTQPTPGQANTTAFIRPEDVPAVAGFAEQPADDNLLISEEVIALILQQSPLRVSEIMYNPQGGSDYEFIELQNVGDAPFDLGGVYFDKGIEFSFHYGVPPLEPGEFVVLAANQAVFAERYPEVEIGGTFDKNGIFDGNLSNSGEQIILKDLIGNVVAFIEYDDENGWPLSADGLGDSLVLINPNGDPTNPHNWRASADLYGSPGRAEPTFGTPISMEWSQRLQNDLHRASDAFPPLLSLLSF